MRRELNDQLKDGGISQATFNALNSALTEKIQGATNSLGELGGAASEATEALRTIGITPSQVESINSLGEALEKAKAQLDLGNVRLDFSSVVSKRLKGQTRGYYYCNLHLKQ